LHRVDLWGRLSNPVQRRLTDTDIDDLAARYQAGATIETLARKFGVHHTTDMDHLKRLDVAPSTLTRELRLAGVRIRRRGRPASG